MIFTKQGRLQNAPKYRNKLSLGKIRIKTDLCFERNNIYRL